MPDDTEKVIYLAFANPNMIDGNIGVDHRACSVCKNKTFVVLYDKPETFPMLRCACCGQDLGRIGWAGEDG